MSNKKIIALLNKILDTIKNDPNKYSGSKFTGDIYQVPAYRKPFESSLDCQNRSCGMFNHNNTRHNCVLLDSAPTGCPEPCQHSIFWSEDPSPYRCTNRKCKSFQKGWANNCMKYKLNWSSVFHCEIRVEEEEIKKNMPYL